MGNGSGVSRGDRNHNARLARLRMLVPVSNAIVGIHRQYFGRGASRARTVMGADYVICFLEDIYTPVERTLIEAGRFPAVQETRSAFQDTMRYKFSEAVEQVVGRKVVQPRPRRAREDLGGDPEPGDLGLLGRTEIGRAHV